MMKVERATAETSGEWAALRARLWQQGCSEFASDADIANSASHAMHQALGFAESERVVYFHKRIG